VPFIVSVRETMRSVALLLVVCVLSLMCASAWARRGVLSLDQDNFDKIVDGSRHIVAAFSEHDYKDSHIWEQVCEEYKSRANVLCVRVATRDSPLLKTRFAIAGEDKDIVVKFFRLGSTRPDADQMHDKLDAKKTIAWVNAKLNPQLEELTRVGRKYAGSLSTSDLNDAEHLLSQLEKQSEHKDFVSSYRTVLKQLQEKGKGYAVKEFDRLSALVHSKSTTDKKREEFEKRLSGLAAFVPADHKFVPDPSETAAADAKKPPLVPTPPRPSKSRPVTH